MKVCAYCLSARGTTSDHVPPKSLLKTPYRPNLRTVPACVDCNNRFAGPEEAFRRALVTYFAHGPNADLIFEGPVSRALDKGPAVERRVWDALGVDGGVPYVELDTTVVTTVARKVVQGLAYIDGRPIGPKSGFLFRLYETVDRPTEIESALSIAQVDLVDAPSFSSRQVEVDGDPIEELWELVFFEVFCCAVGVRRADTPLSGAL